LELHKTNDYKLIKKDMKRIQQLIVLCLAMWTIPAIAQEKSSLIDYDFGADLMSKYVWRGTQFGGSYPVIQPHAELSVGPVKLGAWGAYTIAGPNPYQEFDLYLAADLMDGLFTLTLTDYYFPDTSDYKYFQYNKDKTGHILEGTVAFNGNDKIPFSLLVAMNFYGADAQKINDDPTSPDFNTKSGIQYSSYAELGYAFKIKEVELNAFAGMAFNNPKAADASIGYIGETGFYGTGLGVVNLGLQASKQLQITEKYALPLSCAVITNPQAEKVFLVFGLSF
jgi:hypothetical protein